MKGPEPLIFELSSPGRKAYSLPACDVPDKEVDFLIPAGFLRTSEPELPEVSEVDVVRHYTRLSQLNHGVDIGFYPLGSCTMKYIPKVNEWAARLPGFAWLHPYQPEELVQGALQLMYELQQYLAEIGGVDKVSLQPAAGAHGELTGLLIIRAYHRHRGELGRDKIIVPDSAHGTNPASAAMTGCRIVEVKSDSRGGVDLGELEKVLDERVAALMLTNPNTLGLFDENIVRIARMVHEKGGLLYYDGANANAIMGYSRPGDMGFDVVHLTCTRRFLPPTAAGAPVPGPWGSRRSSFRSFPCPQWGSMASATSLSTTVP